MYTNMHTYLGAIYAYIYIHTHIYISINSNEVKMTVSAWKGTMKYIQ